MNFKLFLSSLIIVLLFIFGFLFLTELGRLYRHRWMNSISGAEREVQLYDHGIQKVWKGKFYVDANNGIAKFEKDGKLIIISGTWVIEEQLER